MSITTTLDAVASSYPQDMVAAQQRDTARIAFNISLALNGREPKGISVCDIGGGVGLFSTGCDASDSALGLDPSSGGAAAG